MRRTILEQEPSRPSSAVARLGPAPASRGARQRSRRLSGDLDTIVLAALRKEPERRYASVARLSEDIRRHLADLPIRTRPDTLGYRAHKFVQRNRVVVAATVAIVLTLGAALAVTSSLLARTVTAQREAEYQASLAHVHAAEAAVRLADLATARADLERTPESMRGWVWHHLHERCDRSIDAWPIDPVGPPASWHIRAVRRDGTRIAVATIDGRLRLLDPETRQSLLEIEHDAYPRAACFSPSGAVLAIGTGSWVAGRSGPFEIRFLDATTGAVLGPPCVGHADAVQGLAYSPDGTLIASAGSDRTVRLWDAATRRELMRFDDHEDEARDVAFAPGGEELTSVGWDGRVVRRALDDGRTLAVLDASGARLASVAYDDAGDLIAAGAVDGHVHVFDRRSGELRARLRGSTDVREVRGFFLPGSSRLWTWGNDGVMQLWDLERSEPRARVLGLGDSVAMLPDASLVTTGRDGFLRRWSVASADVPTWRADGWVYGARLGPDAAWVATTAGVEVHLRIPGRGEVLRTLRHGGALVRDIDTTADGTRLLSCGDGVVDVWDAATGSRVAQMAGDRARFHPSGASLVSIGNNELSVYDAATGERIGDPVALPDLPNHLQPVRAGREVVVAHRDGSLTFCDLERQAVVKRDDTTHARVVEAFALAPGGRGFVTGARDGRLVWWDVATREPVFDFGALPEWTSAVAFSPDGAIMATGGSAGTIRIWDVAERREVGLLRGHLLRVLSLEFSADGTTLVSSSSDGTVRFWTSLNRTAPSR